jgi:predicted dienelactone hydrolase
LLEHRPRHVKLAVDSARADALVGAKLSERYAVIGESIGAYTALAVAGGQATVLPDDFDMSRVAAMSWDELRPFVVRIPPQPDPRVRALVLFSPAVMFFRPDEALAQVDVPVLLRMGAMDEMCPPADVKLSLRSLPQRAQLDALEVPRAGHFSFQTPPPPELAHLPNAQDPEGFDRAAYQAVLKRDVTAFLRRTLSV